MMDVILQIVIFLAIWAALLLLAVFWIVVILTVVGSILGMTDRNPKKGDYS